ncbi:MAG: glycosyltransferase family 4 protein [Deltaproteobacteria bacterium]|nr:glycosyltransferase family 4 protein [Deltaproteobacteria bacterium]
MARILVEGRVLAHAQTSGVERYVAEVSRRLPLAGSMHRFEIARPLSQGMLSQHLWLHFSLPQRCAAGGYDVLFCPANIAPLLKPAAARLVLTVHGIAYRFSPESYSTSFCRYYSWLVPRSLKNADAVVAVSAAEKKSILNEYPWVAPEKIHVIAGGLDHSVFNLDSKGAAQEILKQRYGIRGEFILGVGSFKPVKNFAGLIEAYRAIRNRISAQLVLVGGTPAHGLSESAGITALGHIEADLRYFYQAAKMLVFPSRYEGFGLPPLEAMACGCPVIVSKAGALPEVCGDAAVYVDAEDTQSMAAAIVEMAAREELRDEHIARGSRRAKDFSWEKTAAETIKIFDQLCVR